jgi:hypothetical protein
VILAKIGQNWPKCQLLPGFWPDFGQKWPNLAVILDILIKKYSKLNKYRYDNSKIRFIRL